MLLYSSLPLSKDVLVLVLEFTEVCSALLKVQKYELSEIKHNRHKYFQFWSVTWKSLDFSKGNKPGTRPSKQTKQILILPSTIDLSSSQIWTELLQLVLFLPVLRSRSLWTARELDRVNFSSGYSKSVMHFDWHVCSHLTPSMIHSDWFIRDWIVSFGIRNHSTKTTSQSWHRKNTDTGSNPSPCIVMIHSMLPPWQPANRPSLRLF